MTTETVFIILGYLALFFAFSIGGIWQLRRRRKTKWPFKESDKLLRGPGESLRRKVEGYDQKFAMIYGCSIAGALLIWPIARISTKAIGLSDAQVTSVAAFALVIYALLVAWWVIHLWKERAGYYLGWFGERLVAEKLRPLQRAGYHVFHDVPGEAGKDGFNIDHVVVGPTGVAVVEVKTRRKGAARPGRKEHEVTFDGSKLIWPWGQDRKSVTQTVNEADWIRKWVFQCTGLEVTPKPILAIPGWFVRESPSPMLRVINPDYVTDVVVGSGEKVLEPEQVDLIARQLDRQCRDVED